MPLSVNVQARGRQTSLQCLWILLYLRAGAGTGTYIDESFLRRLLTTKTVRFGVFEGRNGKLFH